MFWNKPKNDVDDQAIVKVFVVALVHPSYNRLACMRLSNNIIIHAVDDGFDWLLVETLTLKPSGTGTLRMQDVDQITHIANMSEFINDATMSQATWRNIQGERMIVLDDNR